MAEQRDTKSGFSDEERAAMQQRAEEIRATKGLKGAAKLAKELEACVAAIDALTGTDKAVATLLHRVVAEEAPGAYKDVTAVVDAAERAGLARKVARVEPVICVKG